jgi:hypothetical protein
MRCLTVSECREWRNAHCRRMKLKRQITFVTPLQRLAWYTAALIEQLRPFDRALLIVDQVVFDVPPKLIRLRRDAGEERPVFEAPGHAFDDDPERVRDVLEAALSGWIDLRVLFAPSKRALSADHDEYTTFFCESSEKVAEVRRVLRQGGVKSVDFVAALP